MYYLRQYKKPLLLIVFTVIIFVAAWLVIFHGRVTITDKNIDSIHYTALRGNDDTKQSDDDSLQLRSGEYSFEVTKKDGNSYIKQVSVPHFFRKIDVSQETKQAQVKKIGVNSLLDIGNVSGATVTSFENGEVKTTSTSDIDGKSKTPNESLPLFSDYTTLGDGLVGGVIRGERGFTAAFYNFATKKATYYPNIETDSLDDALKVSTYGNGFAVLSKKQSKIYFYSYENKKSPEKTIALNEYDLASYDNRSLFVISDKKLVVLEGGRTFSSSDNESLQADDTSYKLTAANQDGRAAKTTGLSFDSPITDVLLSKQSNNIIVSTDKAIRVYDSASLDLIYSLPYQAREILWVDDDDFIFVTNENTKLYKASVKVKTAVSVVSNNLLRFSKLSYVNNKNLYLTAFSNQDEFSSDPDGYIISLNTASKDDNQLIKKLPHQGDGFYVESLNNRLFVQLSRYISQDGVFYDQDAKKHVSDYIQQTLTSSDQYPVKNDYVDVDLR